MQNETPSLYNKQEQAAAFSFSHSCECVHRQCHQCTQQHEHDHTPSGNRCTCVSLLMHMRVRTYRCAHAPVTHIKDKAPRSKLFVIERAHELLNSDRRTLSLLGLKCMSVLVSALCSLSYFLVGKLS